MEVVHGTGLRANAYLMCVIALLKRLELSAEARSGVGFAICWVELRCASRGRSRGGRSVCIGHCERGAVWSRPHRA
eukprot:549010-Prymnesium_polylepis.1